jgi:hypothetical protein
MAKKYPAEFLAKLRAVKAKRPRTVIDHILKHGQITTEELKDLYGYAHPPRAIKDVTDLGIPIERTKAKAKDGRTIAAYRFGDPAAVRGETHAGRGAFPKRFKQQLIDRDGSKCALCRAEFEAALLQIDHRIPYEVAGQAPGELRLEDYMLVCRSCNRGKSWSCEHCPNWIKDKRPEVCQTCFWCQPTSYTHVATVEERRLNLTWRGAEVSEYDELATRSSQEAIDLPDFIKAILRKHVEPG